MLVFLALEPALSVTVLHTRLVDKLIATATILNGVLPLQVQLVALLMQPFEFLCSLVELNLGGLRLSDLLLEFVGLTSHLNGKFFDLKGQLLDLGLISSSELFKSQVVLLLLARGKSPLLKLFLVPIHLQLELVHALVRLEDHVLNVVETVLLVSDPLLQLLDLVAQTAALPLSDLLQVLLRLDFLVLCIDEALCVHQLHLHRLKMVLKNLQTFLMLLDFEAELGHKAHLLANDLVKLLVLIVGIGWEVLIQVVLGDRVHNIVSHCFLLLFLVVSLILIRDLN